MLQGHATVAGTRAYAESHPAVAGHYRPALGLTLSSLGFGSYLGATHAAARAAYQESVRMALAGGVNVLDTASSYREQASERDVGKGIARFIEEGGRRDGFLVVSKAGFLHGDVDEPESDAWFSRTYLESGILSAHDAHRGHSLQPAYLALELERSRRNLGLATLDVLLLHNVEQPLLAGAPVGEFYEAVEDAFVALEEACDAGSLRTYGVATWDGFRVPPGHPGHLELVKLVHHAGKARQRVGGTAAQHHFRCVELPVNHAMPEAALRPTQPFRFGAKTLLECTRDLGMLVLASASLMQMRREPAAEMAAAFGTASDAETALQFTRSVPGVTTALVGMGTASHAQSNALYATRNAPAPGAVKTLLGTGSVHG